MSSHGGWTTLHIENLSADTANQLSNIYHLAVVLQITNLLLNIGDKFMMLAEPALPFFSTIG